MQSIREAITKAYWDEYHLSRGIATAPPISAATAERIEDFEYFHRDQIEEMVSGLQKPVKLLCKLTAKNVRYKTIDIAKEHYTDKGCEGSAVVIMEEFEKDIMNIQFSDVAPEGLK